MHSSYHTPSIVLDLPLNARHFSPVMNLADIASLGGFRMQGAAVDDFAGFNFGTVDINGDGFSDLIVCADGFDGGGLLAGGAFVIYGKADGIPSQIDFGNLAQADGFVVQGEYAFDLASRMIAGVGDVNGDGIEDMVVGAFKNDEGGTDAGAAYIIYGQAALFPSVIDLYGLGPERGIKIVGEAAGDYMSVWIAAAGDVNGDGRDDFIVGAPQNDAGAAEAGAAYVIFGRDGNFTSPIDLATLDSATGFKITGAAAGDIAGLGVSSVGDINGDGISDLAIGAPQSQTSGAGNVYIVYGGASIGALDLAALAPAQGFVVRGAAPGDQAGYNVANAGDVNGDGIDDLILGAPTHDAGGNNAGAAYVVFGTATGRADGLDLSTLDGGDGFRIDGARGGDQMGVSVAGAGDVNGDGLADLLVGGWTNSVNGTGASEAFLLFGKAGGFVPALSLATLDPRDGIRIRSEADGDTTGRAVYSAGDMNGDGYADIAIGSPGNSAVAPAAGTAYVLYGRPDNSAPTAIDARVVGVENVERVFSLTDFGFEDADGDELAEIQIASAVSRGRLVLRGEAASDPVTLLGAGQSVSAAAIAAGRLVFVGDAFESGPAYASFAYTVRDDGGTVASGRDVSSNTATMTIALNADSTNAQDIVLGTTGDDVLSSSNPNATLVGLAGNDLYLVSVASTLVVEVADEGQDTVRTTVSYQLAAGMSVERLEAADAAATTFLRLEGNGTGTTIVGNAGSNSLVAGSGGNNVLTGLGGDDAYIVSSTSDRVVEAVGDGNDTVYVVGDYRLNAGAEIETILSYDRDGSVDQSLAGNDFDNLILANQGNNIIDGGGGRDTMYGYRGDDTYYVDSVEDLPVELFNEGYDTVLAAVSYTLPQGMDIEVLRPVDLDSTAAINLTGNKFANLLIGNAGANILDSGGGGDVMQGLGGDDTYIVSSAVDRVIESAGQGIDTVRTLVDYAAGANSIERIEAYSATDVTPLRLTGNALDQVIVGNAGANALIGGAGADTLQGLTGNDSYVVADARATVVEAVGEGVDTVYTLVSFGLAAGSEIEVLTAYDRDSAGAINLTGNALRQTIYGNAGANQIAGGGGGDTLYGLHGDDTYIVGDAADQVIEYAGQGTDTVLAGTSFSLAVGSEIEVLEAFDATSRVGLRLEGNGFDQRISGTAGNDSLAGGVGQDVLQGLGGNDSYLIDDARAQVIEAVGGGYDTVYATVSYGLSSGSHVEVLTAYDRAASAPLSLAGNEQSNVIYGNAGSNRIEGGAGNDTLFGMVGSDSFVFSTTPGAGNIDQVADFRSGTDRIELDRAVFGALEAGPLAASALVVGAQAQDADDRILYDQANGILYYDADGSGATAAVAFATIERGSALATADILVF